MSSAVGKVTKLFGHDGGVVATLYDASEAINTEEPLFVIFDGLAVPLFIEHFERRGRSSALIRFMDIDSPNRAEMLLGEMLDFDNAVGVAMDYADTHPGTLVIVVADHETGGLTIPAGKENFLLPDSGVEFRWSTGGHTGTMVPMLAYGTGASYFGGIMENTEVNRRMEEILGL